MSGINDIDISKPNEKKKCVLAEIGTRIAFRFPNFNIMHHKY